MMLSGTRIVTCSPSSLNRPKLLLVDDHPANLLVLTKMLQSLDVDLVTASNGRDALAAVAKEDFAAILLDVQMPEMDGFETARHLRAQPGESPIPIIFITASDRLPATAHQGYASGAIDFLYKPIDRFLLLCKLNVLLDLYRHRRQLDDASRALLRINQQMKQLLLSVGDGIIGIAENGLVDFINPAACTLLQASAVDLIGTPVQAATGCVRLDHAAPDSVFATAQLEAESTLRGEIRFRGQQGREFDTEYVLSLVVPPADGGGASWVFVFRDISERQRAIARLRQLAEHDLLTGLANRAHFDRELARLISDAASRNRTCGLMFIDLDGFKRVNDRLGHACGDDLLTEIGRRLRKRFPPPFLCARLGGDEFGVLLPEGITAAQAYDLSDVVINLIQMPHYYGGEPLVVSASIGIALYPEHATAQSLLLRAADLAMYVAKGDRNNRVVFAGPAAN
jgi:diguanylate cyclase (GGDEF)-like protein/PAS domain S-box-containing protein